jgi:hypothetical protein
VLQIYVIGGLRGGQGMGGVRSGGSGEEDGSETEEPQGKDGEGRFDTKDLFRLVPSVLVEHEHLLHYGTKCARQLHRSRSFPGRRDDQNLYATLRLGAVGHLLLRLQRPRYHLYYCC